MTQRATGKAASAAAPEGSGQNDRGASDPELSGGERPGFTPLPNWLYGRATPFELALLGALQLHSPDIRPSMDRLADKAGMKRTCAYQVMADMERKGWVARAPRFNQQGRRLPNGFELRIWPTDEAMARAIGADLERLPRAVEEVPEGTVRHADSRTVRHADSRTVRETDTHEHWASTVRHTDTDCPPDGRGRVRHTDGDRPPRGQEEDKREQDKKEERRKNPLPPQAGEPTAKPAKDRFASKTLPADAIPNDLLDCQQLLPEWWAVKAKGRTETAFNRACALLRRHNPDERRQMLETAIIGGHQGLYPPKATAPRARGRNLGGCTPDGVPIVEAMRRDRWF